MFVNVVTNITAANTELLWCLKDDNQNICDKEMIAKRLIEFVRLRNMVVTEAKNIKRPGWRGGSRDSTSPAGWTFFDLQQQMLNIVSAVKKITFGDFPDATHN